MNLPEFGYWVSTLLGKIVITLWIIGFFSAGLGLAVRPIVSDLLSGIGFMFEDYFDISEKVELPGLAGDSVMGILGLRHYLAAGGTKSPPADASFQGA